MGESKRKKKAGGPTPEPQPAVAGEPAPAELAASTSTGTSTSTNGGDARGAEAEPAPVPLSTAPLPLLKLDAQWLGAFLECCFADKRLVSLCRELKIITPGYRIEALPPEQVARVLAEEYLQAEDVRAPLEQAVREALRRPIFERSNLKGLALAESLNDVVDALCGGDLLQHLACVAWAGLLDETEAKGEQHESALDAIDTGLQLLAQPLARKKGPVDKEEARKLVQEADKQRDLALKEQLKAMRDAESLRAQLEQARAELSQREQKLADERGELERVRAEAVRLSGEVARLTGEGAGRALSDARRAETEARSLADRLQRSEEARAAAEERATALGRDLASAGERAKAPVAAAPAEDLPTEEESADFLVPVLTREFYDSIDRWSRRMQRAAFDKIHRLANDWRHGSLRALALEGVPGYYRIRVATDVRLIYRRDGNQLEILSLIDREDLDRYIRQARTRPKQ